jgi:hypothetical protein
VALVMIDSNGVLVPDALAKQGVANPDGSITYPDGAGGTITSRPDGSSTTSRGGLTQNYGPATDGSGIGPRIGGPVNTATGQTATSSDLDRVNADGGFGGITSWSDAAKTGARSLKEATEQLNPIGTPGLNQDVANDKIFGGPQANQSVFTNDGLGKLLGGVASIYGLGGVLGGSGSGSGTGTAGAGGINTDAISAAAAASRAMSDKFLAEYNAAHPNQPPAMTAAQLPPAAQAEMLGQIKAAQAAGLDPIKAAQAAQLDPFSASHATATLLDPTQQAEQRARALDLEGQYGDVIAGKTPSVAELQLREAEQRQEANQLGLASKASGGGNVALALRTAANNIGRLNQGSSADAALLRAKEIEAAREGLGGLITNTRTGDITFAGHNADLSTDVSKTNAGLDTSATLKAAELEAARRASNAGLTTTAAVKDADLEAARREANAQLTTSAALKDAELEAARRAANAGQINTTNIAQGQLTNTANSNNLTASLEQQRIDAAARDAAAKNAIASSGQVITGTVGAAQAQAEAVKAAQAAKAAEDAKQAAGLGAIGASLSKLLGSGSSSGSGITYGANGSPIIP